MKKTWIKVKRGFLQPEHRTKMGIRIWLYLFIIDQADWETGTVLEWKDKDAADELQMPLPTLRQQRQELEDLGYITCLQQGYKQTITIMRWIDPRSYDGKELNQPKGNDDGNIQGDIQGNETSSPLHRTHISHNHISHKNNTISAVAETEYEPFNIQEDLPQSFVNEYAPRKSGKTRDPRYKHIAYSVYYSVIGRKPSKEMIDDIIAVFGENPDIELVRECRKAWIQRGYSPVSYNWIYWYRDGIPEFAKKSGEPKGFRPVSENSDLYDVIQR